MENPELDKPKPIKDIEEEVELLKDLVKKLQHLYNPNDLLRNIETLGRIQQREESVKNSLLLETTLCTEW